MTLICRFDSQFDQSGKPKIPLWGTGSAGRDTSQRKLKVIVVDDERIIAETLADILNGEGCDATAVSSGLAAVELAREILPDAVISDVAMPDMNGIEAVQLIRAFLPEAELSCSPGMHLPPISSNKPVLKAMSSNFSPSRSGRLRYSLSWDFLSRSSELFKAGLSSQLN